MRETSRFVAFLVIVVAAVSAGYWAGQVALEPPVDPLAVASAPLTYVVEVGSVGRSLSFTAVAEWDLDPVGQNSSAGVVTSINVIVGEAVDSGRVLYTIDLRPVTLAEGRVPMFRSLALNAEGPDVAQLQELLASLGYLTGESDGLFGTSTRAAVRGWQKFMGVDQTGVVEAGDLIFVPTLPVRVTLAETVTVGARLAGGESVVLVVPDDPVFRVPLAVEQATLVPLSADVFVTYPDGVWKARIDRVIETVEFGQLDLFLTGPDGSSVCGGGCADWVDLQNPSDFRAQIVVIPETSGPVVPVAAISTDAANQPSVTLTDGTRVPVTIIESANGIAVVEGVDAGAEILLPVSER